MAGRICSFAALAFFLIGLLPVNDARNHRLSLKGEQRRYFSVTTFGFLVGGELNIEVEALSFAPSTNRVGFSLTRTPTDSVNPYPDGRIEGCPLDEVKEDMYVLTLALDTSGNNGERLVVRCNRNFTDLPISHQENWRPRPRTVRQTSAVQQLFRARRDTAAATTGEAKGVPADSGQSNSGAPASAAAAPVAAAAATTTTPEPTTSKVAAPATVSSGVTTVGRCASASIPLRKDFVDGVPVYSFQFGVNIDKEFHEGLYSLYFHNRLVNPLGFSDNSANLSVMPSIGCLPPFAPPGPVRPPNLRGRCPSLSGMTTASCPLERSHCHRSTSSWPSCSLPSAATGSTCCARGGKRPTRSTF